MSAAKHVKWLTGQERIRYYAVWRAMVGRCTDPSRKDFKRYGAKGVSVCERWRSFSAFAEDMGARPEGATIDRTDGAKGYEPSNCRWATVKEQNRNRSYTRQITWRGQTHCLSEWSEIVGINADTIKSRLNVGWPVEVALTKAPQNCGRTGEAQP